MLGLAATSPRRDFPLAKNASETVAEFLRRLAQNDYMIDGKYLTDGQLLKAAADAAERSEEALTENVRMLSDVNEALARVESRLALARQQSKSVIESLQRELAVISEEYRIVNAALEASGERNAELAASYDHIAERYNEQCRRDKEHCRNCCCARSWAALGITEYTGKSIPEHIELLRSELAALRQRIADAPVRWVSGCTILSHRPTYPDQWERVRILRAEDESP